jgi:hypothetical protein
VRIWFTNEDRFKKTKKNDILCIACGYRWDIGLIFVEILFVCLGDFNFTSLIYLFFVKCLVLVLVFFFFFFNRIR